MALALVSLHSPRFLLVPLRSWCCSGPAAAGRHCILLRVLLSCQLCLLHAAAPLGSSGKEQSSPTAQCGAAVQAGSVTVMHSRSCTVCLQPTKVGCDTLCFAGGEDSPLGITALMFDGAAVLCFSPSSAPELHRGNVWSISSSQVPLCNSVPPALLCCFGCWVPV